MKATQRLRDAGQSLWLDNISRGLLTGGGLERYNRNLSVSGLTSNPTIFDHAIRKSPDYDAAIRTKTAAGSEAESLAVRHVDRLRGHDGLQRPRGSAVDDEPVPLERAAEAYERMMSGRARFRVVLTTSR